jgi:hypothetical protein
MHARLRGDMGSGRGWLPGCSDPAAAMSDVHTLGEIAARASMLTVACSRCETPRPLPARCADRAPRCRGRRARHRPRADR